MHQGKADLGADDNATVAPFHPLQVGQSPVDNYDAQNRLHAEVKRTPHDAAGESVDVEGFGCRPLMAVR